MPEIFVFVLKVLQSTTPNPQKVVTLCKITTECNDFQTFYLIPNVSEWQGKTFNFEPVNKKNKFLKFGS